MDLDVSPLPLQIYFVDLQIWYTILSSLVGTAVGAWWHLGEVRERPIPSAVPHCACCGSTPPTVPTAKRTAGGVTCSEALAEEQQAPEGAW